jgi:hypothetical protein
METKSNIEMLETKFGIRAVHKFTVETKHDHPKWTYERLEFTFPKHIMN